MSLSPDKKSEQSNSANHKRRQFISTALLGGISMALAQPTQAAPAVLMADEVLDVLPSPADSLSQYISLVDTIQRNILRNYYALISCLAKEVRDRYKELSDDVREFERMVPQLRAENLKSAVDVGQASASSIKSMADGGFAFPGGSLLLISFSSERLNDSLTELEQQKGSVTLPPRAVELLRKIFREIRELNQPVKSLEESSRVLTDLDNDLTNKVTGIKTKIKAAVSLLIAVDLSKSSTGKQQDDALGLIQSAVTDLQKLDAYTPPETLQNYVAKKPAPQCKEIRLSSENEKPTQILRTLLEATAKWITSGNKLYQSSSSDKDKTGEALTNHAMAPAGLGLWFSVRGVLREFLPEASRARTFSCLLLIGPVLAAYGYNQRYSIIYDLIPNLFPGGAADLNNNNRMQAADRLARL
ncbi:MAG: hypothetical protein ICV60_00920 [Pyrinomonadaceae bacterium]|nr:hypothetical protein [Pyrinomonadaceae bacterium]